MKRKYYNISLDDKIVATRFAWNSAVKAVEQLVKERSRSLVTWGGPPVIYNLIASTADRSPTDKYTVVSGLRTWQSSTETLHFVIALRV